MWLSFSRHYSIPKQCFTELTIFRGVFLAFNLNDGIFHGIFLVPHNIVVILNNVMLMRPPINEFSNHHNKNNGLMH